MTDRIGSARVWLARRYGTEAEAGEPTSERKHRLSFSLMSLHCPKNLPQCLWQVSSSRISSWQPGCEEAAQMSISTAAEAGCAGIHVRRTLVLVLRERRMHDSSRWVTMEATSFAEADRYHQALVAKDAGTSLQLSDRQSSPGDMLSDASDNRH